MTRTPSQRRAEHALARVHSLQGQDYGHFVSYTSALPATIVSNTLGQALTMLLAKAKGKQEDPHYLLYDCVATWLSQEIPQLAGSPAALIDRIMAQDEIVYLRAQAEAMQYLGWLKQFARAYLQEQEGTDG